MIDNERQLSEKMVDKDMRNTLKRSNYITPEYLFLINAILTLPKTSLEKKY